MNEPPDEVLDFALPIPEDFPRIDVLESLGQTENAHDREIYERLAETTRSKNEAVPDSLARHLAESATPPTGTIPTEAPAS